MTAQGWKSLLTPESSALARFRTDPEAWPDLAFQPAAADSGPARRGGPRPGNDPAGPTRTQLLWAIQYDWQPADLPLLRFLLEQQIKAVEHAGEEATEGLDDLSRAVRLVARGHADTDVLQLYHAVHLLITNPVQPDQSWVSYYSELASLQSGMNHPDQPADGGEDPPASASGGLLGESAQFSGLEDSSIQLGTQRGNVQAGGIYSSGVRRDIPRGADVPRPATHDTGPGSSGIRRAFPRGARDDSDPGSSGIWRMKGRRTAPQAPGTEHVRPFESVGLGELTGTAEAAAHAETANVPIEPSAPGMTDQSPVIPPAAESAPAWSAGPGAGQLTEPAGDRSIESQVSRAFMAGGPEPAASVVSEWAANRPENFESLNTQTELYASLGEYAAAADAARRLVALPDPAQPDPDLARFEALRRVARLERQSGHMDAAWRCLGEAQQHLGEHPHWREFSPGQALATEYFLLAAALDPEESMARAALKTGDKLTRKLATLDEYLRQVALRAAEHCADERLRRRYSRPIA